MGWFGFRVGGLGFENAFGHFDAVHSFEFFLGDFEVAEEEVSVDFFEFVFE